MPLTPQYRAREARLKFLAPLLAERDTILKPNLVEWCKQNKTSQAFAASIRETDWYRDAMKRFSSYQTRVINEGYKERTIETRQKLRDYADQAPDVLYKIMMDEEAKHPARISAASELLDRDGRFAKVSRLMNVREGEDGAPMLPEDAAEQMLEALDKAGITVKKHNYPDDRKPN